MPLVATQPVLANETHVFLGDSTANKDNGTAWWGAPGGTTFAGDQIQALVDVAHPAQARPARTVGGNVARTVGDVGGVRQGLVSQKPVLINGGVNGAQVPDTRANLATRLLAYKPGFVWITLGTNDIGVGFTAGQFQTNYSGLLADIAAALPTAKIACTYVPFRGEIWDTGPVWNNGAIDATIDSFNAAILACATAATLDCMVIDFRATMLIWESLNNPTKSASGNASPDGIHWNDAGRAAVVSQVLSKITVP